jgi:hypothetical protein
MTDALHTAVQLGADRNDHWQTVGPANAGVHVHVEVWPAAHVCVVTRIGLVVVPLPTSPLTL